MEWLFSFWKWRVVVSGGQEYKSSIILESYFLHRKLLFMFECFILYLVVVCLSRILVLVC